VRGNKSLAASCLRNAVKQNLTAAAKDGSLMNIANAMALSTRDSIRMEAMRSLSAAADTGSLLQTCSAISTDQEEPIAAVIVVSTTENEVFEQATKIEDKSSEDVNPHPSIEADNEVPLPAVDHMTSVSVDLASDSAEESEDGAVEEQQSSPKGDGELAVLVKQADADSDSEEGSDEESDEEETEDEEADVGGKAVELPQSKGNAASESVSHSEEEESDDESVVKVRHFFPEASDSEDASDDELDTESCVEDAGDKTVARGKLLGALQVVQEQKGLGKVSPTASPGPTRMMSETQAWRANVLGHECVASPAPSPVQHLTLKPVAKASPVVGRPPYAPAFEVAKLPAGLPTVDTGAASRSSGHAKGQGSAASSGRQQVNRAASEGRFSQRNVDYGRMAVFHAPLDALEYREMHPDSLLARARAPAPLPSRVAAPQGPCQPRYAPPERDTWELPGFPRDAAKSVVQVMRLESKPYVRSGQCAPEQEFNSNHQKKKGGLSGIYGALVQPRQRALTRVQSLPFLPQCPSPEMSRVDAYGSPQRFLAIR